MEKQWATIQNADGTTWKETLIADNPAEYSSALIEFLNRCNKYGDKDTIIELSIIDESVDHDEDMTMLNIERHLSEIHGILNGTPVIPVEINSSKKVHKKYLDSRFDEVLVAIQDLWNRTLEVSGDYDVPIEDFQAEDNDMRDVKASLHVLQGCVDDIYESVKAMSEKLDQQPLKRATRTKKTDNVIEEDKAPEEKSST